MQKIMDETYPSAKKNGSDRAWENAIEKKLREDYSGVNGPVNMFAAWACVKHLDVVSNAANTVTELAAKRMLETSPDLAF